MLIGKLAKLNYVDNDSANARCNVMFYFKETKFGGQNKLISQNGQ